jgi:hypothetical protein
MKLQRLKDNSLMIIIPPKQISRWRRIINYAHEYIFTSQDEISKWSSQDKAIMADLEELAKEIKTTL